MTPPIFSTVAALLKVRAVAMWRGTGKRHGIQALVGALLYLALFAVTAIAGVPLVQQWVSLAGPPGLAAVFLVVQLGWLLSSLGGGLGPALINRRPVAHLPISAGTLVLTDLLLVGLAPGGPPALLLLGGAAGAMYAFGPAGLSLAALAALVLALMTALLIQGVARIRNWVARGRLAFLVFIGALAGMSVVFWWAATQGAALLEGQALARLARTMGRAASVLPTVAWPAAVAEAGVNGRLGRAAAILLASLASIAIGFGALVFATRREMAGPSGHVSLGRHRTVSLGGPSSVGRFVTLVGRELKVARRNPTLLFPAGVVTILLCGATLRWPADRVTAYLGAMPALATLIFSSNAYGFDRNAARTLFALPVTATTVLAAKNVAAGALAGCVFAVPTIVGLSCGRLRNASSALVTFVLTAGLTLALGNLLSVHSPKAMWPRLGGIPRAVALWQLGQMFAVFSLIDGLRELFQAQVAATIAASLLVPMLLCSVSLWYAGRRLWQDRERVLQALSASETL